MTTSHGVLKQTSFTGQMPFPSPKQQSQSSEG